MKITHLSNSRMDIYNACTMQYFYTYEEQPMFYSTVTGWGAGSLSHEALEFFYLRRPEDRTWENLEKDIWKGAAKVQEKDPGIIKDVFGFLAIWFARKEPGEERLAMYKNKPAVELKFDLILANGGAVTGRIDKVNQIDSESIEIIDYKSNWQVYSKDEVIDSMQLALYSLACRQYFPWAKNIYLKYDFLRHADVTREPYTDEELEFVVLYLQHMWDTIKNDNSPVANVNPQSCRWCNAHKSCKEYQFAITNNLMPDQGATVGELLLERKELESRMKAVEGRKKEIDQVILGKIKSSDTKTIEIEGVGVARLQQSRKVAYPSKVVCEVLGDKSYLVTSVSKKKIDKILPTLEPHDRQRILDSSSMTFTGGWLTVNYEKPVEKKKEGLDDGSKDGGDFQEFTG